MPMSSESARECFDSSSDSSGSNDPYDSYDMQDVQDVQEVKDSREFEYSITEVGTFISAPSDRVCHTRGWPSRMVHIHNISVEKVERDKYRGFTRFLQEGTDGVDPYTIMDNGQPFGEASMSLIQRHYHRRFKGKGTS